MSDSSSSGPSGPDNGERRDPDQPYGQDQYGRPDQPYGQGQHDQGQYDQGQYGYNYPQQGAYYGGYQAVPDHPQATMALTLGLIGLIGTMLCLVPSVIGPFAWFVGAKAKKEIDASGGQLGGRGQALTGYVLGIITTVLLVLVILGVGALLAVAFTVGFENPDQLQY